MPAGETRQRETVAFAVATIGMVMLAQITFAYLKVRAVALFGDAAGRIKADGTLPLRVLLFLALAVVSVAMITSLLTIYTAVHSGTDNVYCSGAEVSLSFVGFALVAFMAYVPLTYEVSHVVFGNHGGGGGGGGGGDEDEDEDEIIN